MSAPTTRPPHPSATVPAAGDQPAQSTTHAKLQPVVPQQLTGAQAVIRSLEELGVDIIFGIPVALFIAWRAWVSSAAGRRQWDAFVLKFPVIGPLVRKIAVARFSRTLGTMLSSGVPILDALEIVAKSAGNKVIERAILVVRARIAEGKNIAGPLAETKVFPPMVVQMIGVGEATGAMDQMLSKIADFYDDEVDTAVEALTSLLEPLMMVFLGGSIGAILIAMYLPIFKLAENIK